MTNSHEPHAPGLCPNCGYRLKHAQAVTLGPWQLFVRATLYEGSPLAFTPQQSLLMHCLALSHPLPARREVLVGAVCPDALFGSNVISVQVHRIRQKLKHWGLPDPIDSGRQRRGYTWRTEP